MIGKKINCFYLLNEKKPIETGYYRVITTKGMIIRCYYENFIGNDIWETNAWLGDNDKILAWSLENKIK